VIILVKFTLLCHRWM